MKQEQPYTLAAEHGFSLVELSIVLVILGLLTGGILAGQSLIRAAEIRSVSTEYEQYVTAIRAFRDRYMALPGDMTNATSFWNAAPSCPDLTKSEDTNPATCNGTGDGHVSRWNNIGVGNGYIAEERVEQYTFWQHLANAGLISGAYTGNLQGSYTDDRVIGHELGINIPQSKLNMAGWMLYTYPMSSSILSEYFGSYPGNLGSITLGLGFGRLLSSGGTVGDIPANALTPSEAWNLDVKMDDGKPLQGSVRSTNWDLCTTAASATSLVGDYDLTYSEKACGLVFPAPL